jgi:hypothetical protein
MVYLSGWKGMLVARLDAIEIERCALEGPAEAPRVSSAGRSDCATCVGAPGRGNAASCRWVRRLGRRVTVTLLCGVAMKMEPVKERWRTVSILEQWCPGRQVSSASEKVESAAVLWSSVATVAAGLRWERCTMDETGRGDAPRGQRNSDRGNRVAECRIGIQSWTPEMSTSRDEWVTRKIGDWIKKGRV